MGQTPGLKMTDLEKRNERPSFTHYCFWSGTSQICHSHSTPPGVEREWHHHPLTNLYTLETEPRVYKQIVQSKVIMTVKQQAWYLLFIQQSDKVQTFDEIDASVATPDKRSVQVVRYPRKPISYLSLRPITSVIQAPIPAALLST